MAYHSHSDKASRYLHSLDLARCRGEWEKVPELARKVQKHAPSRECLVITARAEAEIAKEALSRPGTARSSSNPLSHLVPGLSKARADEKKYLEDAYQAAVCLSWLNWIIGDLNVALESLPSTLPITTSATTEKKQVLADWTNICLVKSAVIRGSSEEAAGVDNEQVIATYESALRELSGMPKGLRSLPEYRLWWERFLVRCCIVLHRSYKDNSTNTGNLPDRRPSFAAFRSWAEHWREESILMPTLQPIRSRQRSNRRRTIWRLYYDFLSDILYNGIQYSTKPLSDSSSNGATMPQTVHRASHYVELCRVEKAYERILLDEVSFPEANEINHEVDDWTNQVMLNWSIVCGPDWQDEELGDGGKEQASRNVLDILYRAATRTFHSTTVLRHLFTVHASLSEFELAEKALDSYIEIITKGKSRVEKSGSPEPGLDSDEIMLQTIAGGIGMLCEFGGRGEVERALDLSVYIERWLSRHDVISSVVIEEGVRKPQSEASISVSGQTLASVHKAIAISKMSWARFTFEESARAPLQASAITHLRLALQSYHEAEEDCTILYALALMLAETRDIEGAIAVVKQALSSESQAFTEPIDQKSLLKDIKARRTRKRSLVECWHLLALLLSARQQFETAEALCHTALDHAEAGRSFSTTQTDGRHCELSYFEKQQIVEVKMTQAALTEINEGSEAAVNAGGELLALYTSLFEVSSLKPQTAKSLEPPQTSSGTIRSLRNSLFGRGRSTRVASLPQDPAAVATRSRRASADTTRPPTIAVTEEESTTSPPSIDPSRLTHHPSHKLQKRPSKKSVQRSRTVSPVRSRATSQLARAPSAATKSTTGDARSIENEHLRPATAVSYNQDEVGVAVSHDLRASVAAQFDTLSLSTLPPQLTFRNGSANQPGQSSHTYTSSLTSFKTPHFKILPPRFSKPEQQWYALTLLNKIWLFIAAFYRRAGMFDDAQGAFDEAFKQAKLIEAAVATRGSSVRKFERAGWGGTRSVEQVWADSYSEMGNLSLAQSRPHDAMIKFEGALSHYPDHLAASISLSNLLLDTYTQKVSPEPENPSLQSQSSFPAPADESTLPVLAKFPPTKSPQQRQPASIDGEAFPTFDEEESSAELQTASLAFFSEKNQSPEALDRLAARDRAYGILSSLTKLGSGWDNSEAWFALARSYEESGQLDKANEVLWWVVELEEKRPIRHWSCLGQGYNLLL